MRFIKDRHKWLFTLLLASSQALWATHALAVVYQWQDADGSMVYSQLPPGDGRPVREVPPPPPPATRPEQAEQELEQLRQRARQRIEQRQRARDKDIAERAALRIRAQNCEAARKNLRQVEQGKRLLMNDGKGGMRRMSPAEQAQRVGQYRKDVEKFCR